MLAHQILNLFRGGFHGISKPDGARFHRTIHKLLAGDIRAQAIDKVHPQLESRGLNHVEQIQRTLHIDIEDIVNDVEIPDAVSVVKRGNLLKDIGGAAQPDTLPMTEAISAAIDAPPARQQHSLPPVIVGVAKLAPVLIDIDQVVGREGQTVNSRILLPLGVLHHPVTVPVQNSRDRAGRRAGKQFNKDLFSFSLNGNFHFRHFFEEPMLVGLNYRPADHQRGVAVGAHQRGNAL